MDSVTALITIVQLIAIFAQESGDVQQKNHGKFLEWLKFHKLEELKELISNNAYLTDQVQQLLQQNHSVIFARINELNDKVARILASMDSFTGMVQELAPDRIISANAFEILSVLFDGSVPDLIWTGTDTMQLSTRKESIRFLDARFLTDDVNALVQLGFLTNEPLVKSFRCLKITRKGIEFLEKVNTTKIS